MAAALAHEGRPYIAGFIGGPIDDAWGFAASVGEDPSPIPSPPLPPGRPTSACGGRSQRQLQRLSARQAAVTPRRPAGCGAAAVNASRMERPSSASSAPRAKSPSKAKEGHDAMSALVLAMLQIYEHRSKADIWVKLLDPLRALVPCEDAKMVVRSIGPPKEEHTPGPFDPECRPRVRAIKHVEHWPHQRIEGQCALTQRICCIPSPEAERQRWHQYETTSSMRNVSVEQGPAVSSSSYLRCMAAVPLFDAQGSVLAVVKLINRRSFSDGAPRMEFSRADLATLSAFSAIFACVMPSPYLGLPGACIPRRPEARLWLTDDTVGALVTWQIPRALRGQLVHEILYGAVEHEDEFASCRRPQDGWRTIPCGILDPLPGTEDTEPTFEFRVPNLQAGFQYRFSVRVRNLETALEWSEPSNKLSTTLVPPHPVNSEVVHLFPGSETTLELEWEPFQTCDPGVQFVEYRVVAIPDQDQPRSSLYGDGLEQVVAVFISDGSSGREVAKVTSLQTSGTYTFAIEARYPLLGTREFTRALVSDRFSFPTVDLTLPAPQPLTADSLPAGMAGTMGSPRIGSDSTASPLLIRWPYPADVTPKLTLQYRTASLPPEEPGAAGPRRLHISTWCRLQPGDGLRARLTHAGVSSELRILQDPALDGWLAVQLRVGMPQGHATSPPSSWFHAQPPQPPEAACARLVCSDEGGVAVHVQWHALPKDWLLSTPDGSPIAGAAADARANEELGPVSYAVHYDFSRGHGPSPTQFQIRLRLLQSHAEPPPPWQEQPPQLLPPPIGSAEGSGSCKRRKVHSWQLQEQRWFSQPGTLVEVQIRHGNALFWSPWAAAGCVELQAAPPRPPPGQVLRLEDVRTDSVRLVWPPFAPEEGELRELEYRILCAELPEGDDARPEAAGCPSSWRTLDVVLADGEADAQGGGDTAAHLHYVVRPLQPDRRYSFAVECRYAGLPPGLAVAASSRLVAADPLPQRELQLSVLPEGPTASVELVPSPDAAAGEGIGAWAPGRGGLSLRLRWRFRAQPAGTPLPQVLCYQLCCVPAWPDDQAAASVALPPAMLSEGARGGAGAGYSVDGTRDGATAEVELCTAAIEAFVPATRLQFAVRVGDPASGTWSGWSEGLSEVVDLTVLPPAPAEGAAVTIIEELLPSSASSPRAPPPAHGVAAVTLAWAPFEAPPGLRQEQHMQLAVEYEAVVWCADVAAPSPAEARAALCRRLADPPGLHAVSRHTLKPMLVQGEGRQLHKLRVSGDHLHAGRHHFFQILARYLLPTGESLPEPKPPASGLLALVSGELYRPTPRPPAAPVVDAFPLQQGQAPGRCVLLRLHQDSDADDGADPPVLEVREGRPATPEQPEGGSGHGSAADFVPVGSWVPVAREAVECLGGDRSRVLVRDLPMQICQFRVRRGAAESRPSAWADTVVWRPLPLFGDQLCEQVRAAAAGGALGAAALQGLGVAMGVGHDTALFARLLWPRRPPQPMATQLTQYQVRYRVCGDEWSELPFVDLPPNHVPLAECQVSELVHGQLYEFAIRLGSALGRWSEWSPPTTPLRLELPPPVPGRSMEHGGLRVAVLNPATVKLVWRPFTVPCQSSAMEAPILLDAAPGLRGTVQSDYEVVVHSKDGSVMAVVQREAHAMFDGLHFDNNDGQWIEADLPLEPHRSCSFEIRARLSRGAWGPSVLSPWLPARLSLPAAGRDGKEDTSRLVYGFAEPTAA